MRRKRADRQYIFVTGGVLSGIGKGITAASIGAVLTARGVKVSIQKCDPYLNVDAGTLNPAEHGECFVTKDGAETDLDLGHYERFLDIEVTRESATLSGRLLRDLIQDERDGQFLGKTVQLVPHLTTAIQSAIERSGKGSEVHIVEIGGTVGDYEGLAYLEAIRELAAKIGRENCLFVHVVYVPYLLASKEFKTKPAQNAISGLRGFGIMPDIIAARTEYPTNGGAKLRVTRKLSLFGGVPEEGVVLLPNADTVYQVPLTLEEASIGHYILKKFGRRPGRANMSVWRKVLKNRASAVQKTPLKIGIIAKYLENEDAYFSVIEALKAAAWEQKVNIEIDWIDSEALERKGTDSLSKFDALVGLPGFGSRGFEGKIAAASFAMDQKVPYLGICLGLQMAVIAAARKGGLKDANTSEADPNTKHPVIYIMDDQRGKESTGGTMRLGDYTCKIVKGSLAEKVYGTLETVERHRHRYEVNQKYREYIERGGLSLSGFSPDGRLVEMIEHQNHPYFIATQGHPEFRSRPMRPRPLFSGLIKAAKQAAASKTQLEGIAK